MRDEIICKYNSEDAFADEWFQVDIEDGESQYISITTIKPFRFRFVKEENE